MKAKPKGQPSSDMDVPDLCISWKDMQSLVATWLVREQEQEAIEQRFGIPVSELPFVLRLYDVTDRMIKNDGLDQYVDFTINFQAPEWLLFGIEITRRYCVELGVRMVDGRYYSLKRSNVIHPCENKGFKTKD